MTIAEIQQEILRMKKGKRYLYSAHGYQGQGNSGSGRLHGRFYGLECTGFQKRFMQRCDHVRCSFYGRNLQSLSLEKEYGLQPAAGCPMAEQLDLEGLRELKAQYPDYAVAAYINTTSELKTECDVASLLLRQEICKNSSRIKILFIPDPNLGHCSRKLPKNLCILQRRMSETYRGKCKRRRKSCAAHSGCSFLVHPKCRQEVVEQAGLRRFYHRNHEFAKNRT